MHRFPLIFPILFQKIIQFLLGFLFTVFYFEILSIFSMFCPYGDLILLFDERKKKLFVAFFKKPDWINTSSTVNAFYSTEEKGNESNPSHMKICANMSEDMAEESRFRFMALWLLCIFLRWEFNFVVVINKFLKKRILNNFYVNILQMYVFPLKHTSL